MAGLAPAIPLRRDETDGYRLVKSFEELAHQNLKMLVLTVPGERMMDPNFGVGLKKYLFEQNSPLTHGAIETKIRSQTSSYLPYIKILSVDFNKTKGVNFADQLLSVRISFFIGPLRIKSSLLFDLEWNSSLL